MPTPLPPLPPLSPCPCQPRKKHRRISIHRIHGWCRRRPDFFEIIDRESHVFLRVDDLRMVDDVGEGGGQEGELKGGERLVGVLEQAVTDVPGVFWGGGCGGCGC